MMRKKLSVTTIKHSTLIESHHFSLTKGGALIYGDGFYGGCKQATAKFSCSFRTWNSIPGEFVYIWGSSFDMTGAFSYDELYVITFSVLTRWLQNFEMSYTANTRFGIHTK